MMVSTLNKVGISEIFVDLLKSDSTLYGNGKLLNYITFDPGEFSEATITIEKPYAMYLWAEPDATIEERASNVYEEYAVGVRIRGKTSKLFTATKQVDKIWERVKFIVRANMTSGDMLSTYHSDSNAQAYSYAPVASDLPTPEGVEGEYITECNGAIEVFVNRY